MKTMQLWLFKQINPRYVENRMCNKEVIMRNDDLSYIQTTEEVPAFWWGEYAMIWLDKTRYEKEEVLLFHACLKKFFLKYDTKSIHRVNEVL